MADDVEALLREALAEDPDRRGVSPPPERVAEDEEFLVIEAAVPPAVAAERDAAVAALRRLLSNPNHSANPNDMPVEHDLPPARSLHAKAGLLDEAVRLAHAPLLLRVLLQLRRTLSDSAFFPLVQARPAASRRWMAHLRSMGDRGKERKAAHALGLKRHLALLAVREAFAAGDGEPVSRTKTSKGRGG